MNNEEMVLRCLNCGAKNRILKETALVLLNIFGLMVIVNIKKAGIRKKAIGWFVSKNPRQAKQK